MFFECPRCGTKTLERLTTYSHCIECLYFKDHFYDLGFAYNDAWEAEAYLAKHHKITTTNKKIELKNEFESWIQKTHKPNTNLKES